MLFSNGLVGRTMTLLMPIGKSHSLLKFPFLHPGQAERNESEVTVMLNSPEVETQFQAKRDGRFVDLGRILDILRFSRVGVGVVGRDHEQADITEEVRP